MKRFLILKGLPLLVLVIMVFTLAGSVLAESTPVPVAWKVKAHSKWGFSVKSGGIAYCFCSARFTACQPCLTLEKGK